MKLVDRVLNVLEDSRIFMKLVPMDKGVMLQANQKSAVKFEKTFKFGGSFKKDYQDHIKKFDFKKNNVRVTNEGDFIWKTDRIIPKDKSKFGVQGIRFSKLAKSRGLK